jgi:hypothetical protein
VREIQISNKCELEIVCAKQIQKPGSAADKESRVTQWILISPFQAAERREIYLAAKHSPHLEAKSNPLLVNGTVVILLLSEFLSFRTWRARTEKA